MVKAELFDGAEWRTDPRARERQGLSKSCASPCRGRLRKNFVRYLSGPGQIHDFTASKSRAAWKVVSLDGADEATSGWRLVQECEVYAEGAVFFTWELTRLGDGV